MDYRLDMASVSRRDILKYSGAGAFAALTASVMPGLAQADAAAVTEAIKKAVGGKTPSVGKMALTLPQIAENGSTVPVAIEVESAMSGTDMVKTIHLFAEGNPSPNVASFHFTDMSGKAWAATRMRMAKTQNVVAVAEMADGSVRMAKAEVKVTIGGCGG